MVLESLENRPAAVCPYYLCECDEYSHSWMAAIPECELRFCDMTNRKGCQVSQMLNGDEESISITIATWCPSHMLVSVFSLPTPT